MAGLLQWLEIMLRAVTATATASIHHDIILGRGMRQGVQTLGQGAPLTYSLTLGEQPPSNALSSRPRRHRHVRHVAAQRRARRERRWECRLCAQRGDGDAPEDIALVVGG